MLPEGLLYYDSTVNNCLGFVASLVRLGNTLLIRFAITREFLYRSAVYQNYTVPNKKNILTVVIHFYLQSETLLRINPKQS